MFNRIVGAALLIGVGIIVFLRLRDTGDINLGYIISTFWPVILLYLGFNNLKERNNVGGLVLLTLGIYFMGKNLGFVSLSFGDLFRYAIPAALVGGGLYVLLSPRRRDRKKHKEHSESHHSAPFPNHIPVEPEPPMYSDLDQQFEQKFGKTYDHDDSSEGKKSSGEEDYHFEHNQKHQHKNKHHKNNHHKKKHEYNYSYEWDNSEKNTGYTYNDGSKLNKSTFIGEIKLGDEYYELKPTNISQFIGDTVIDLTKAQIPYGETRINISAFIGDIKVFTPRDMDLGIIVNSNSFIGDMTVLSETKSGFMGNVSAQTPNYKEAEKKVRIVVSVFIGDVKVNSVG
ncbi:cell wall-active antibiotics response protein LiaF [Paenibacillus provencensis]|uniref:Cell wall-active antibiotics response protein LiaF n=1 Tax=Paenibacillus provencensis TaxID=441151 RepID=A0ABW3PTJ4_9BACL|nr:cell wall-active antibiotics response protein LiaF [Paenibacillus sp. MER 78]MCM3127373.1 cell wall-active antibiotics response protein LiaF [Paenibacillus sp. MER 78]